MRIVRTLTVTAIGYSAGMATAAAVVKRAVPSRGDEESDEVGLVANALNGGIAVKVPSGWRVQSSLKALAGGVDVRMHEPDDPTAPTLTLDGSAAFGGVFVGAKSGATAEN